MAEGFLRKLKNVHSADWLDIKSCGTGATPGLKVPKIVLKIILDEGVDLSDHISTPVNKLIAGVSDYIFTMEEHHKNEIIRRYPELKDRVYLLKEFAINRKLDEPDVADPIGQPDEVYLQAAAEIKGLVEKLFTIIDKKRLEQ